MDTLSIVGFNRNKSRQLSDANLYLGPQVDKFLNELGITRSSPELAPWLKKVRAFYCEAISKAQKYFRPCLTSKVLRAMDVFDPEVFFNTELDDVKSKFKIIASRFSNIIKLIQIPELLDQVSCLHSKDEVKKMTAVRTPVQIFSRLLTW